MPATTTLLGLVTPTQGTLSGTWGDTVNYGISDYVDIAVAGTLTLTNDGAVTLANTTGSSSGSSITSSLTGAGTVTAQFAIVKVTGTLTVAKVVTGPSYSKTYTVVNAATGGIVTFKASGQTGVSVAVGESAFVYFNGTDYVKIVGTATAGAAGGSTTQVQFNSSGILSGSSSLTWNGTSLSTTQLDITAQGTLRLQDTTGGEYVALRAPATLGANYTLTFPADDGTSGQALITDGSGVLSWSTAASGDVYGPGSSTDNAVARFDGTTGKLIQNGVVIIGDTGAVTGVTDLTASGSVTLSGGTANGVTYLNGSKVLTSGSALTFDGTTLGVSNGSAGSAGISITGTYAGSGTVAFLNFQRVGGAVAGTLGYDDASTAMRFGTTTNHSTIFLQNNAEAMRLTSTSLYTASAINVGFGTSNPYDRLEASKSSSGGLGAVIVATNSATQATGNAASIGFRTSTSFNSSGFYSARIAAEQEASGAGDIATVFYRYGATPSGVESMRLDASGNLLLGTTLQKGPRLNVMGGDNVPATSGSTQNGGLRVSSLTTGSGGYVLDMGVSNTNAYAWMQVSNSANLASGFVKNLVIQPVGGNLGVGINPNAFANGWSAIQIGAGALSYSGTGSFTSTQLSDNAFFTGSGSDTVTASYIYGATPATNYKQYNGQHRWYNAPVGVALDPITFNQAMTLDASSNLYVGLTPVGGSAKFVVKPSSTYGMWCSVGFSDGTPYGLEFGLQPSHGSYRSAVRGIVESYGGTDSGALGFYTSNTYNTGAILERMRITSGGDMEFKNSSGTSVSFIGVSSTAAQFGNRQNDAMIFYTNNTDRGRFTSSGQFMVGLGPNNAQTYELGVYKGASDVRFLINSDNGYNAYINFAGFGGGISYGRDGGTGYFRWNSALNLGGTQIMTLTDGGSLGIGTTSPGQKLDVDGNIRSRDGGITLSVGTTQQGVFCTYNRIFGSGTDYTPTIFAETGLGLTFAVNGVTTKAMSLTSAGKLLVGQTSLVLNNNNRAEFTGSCGIGTISTGGAAFSGIQTWNQAGTGDNVFVEFLNDAGGTLRGSITYNRAGGLTVYNTTSDYRAKDISGPVTNSGELIDSVPVYMGKMKDATQERPMFIAHETPAYAHTGEKDAVDADGNPVYQKMDASTLIPVMWAEIQSLRKRLADAGI